MTGFCEAELEGVKRGKNVYTFHMQNQKNKLTLDGGVQKRRAKDDSWFGLNNQKGEVTILVGRE